jgi:hypothetical protein
MNFLMRHGAILDFLLPRGIRPDLFGALIVETSDILLHIEIVGFPVVKMAEKQVMIPALDFAERDQVGWIKFQLRKQVEWSNMVDL